MLTLYIAAAVLVAGILAGAVQTRRSRARRELRARQLRWIRPDRTLERPRATSGMATAGDEPGARPHW